MPPAYDPSATLLHAVTSEPKLTWHRRYANHIARQHYDAIAGALQIAVEGRNADYVPGAAWLIGVDPPSLPYVVESACLGEKATRLLADVHALRRLNPDDLKGPSGIRRIREEVLRERDPWAIALYALDALETLDPGGVARAWLADFRAAPSVAPARPTLPEAAPLHLSYARGLVLPVVEVAGMWAERCDLDDLLCWHTNKTGFHMAESLVRSWVPTCLDDAVRLLTRVLEEETGWMSARVGTFRLRHLASIARGLAGGGAGQWATHLHRLGFLEVEVGDRRDAFSALGLLLAARPHVPESIRDVRRAFGYRATHVRVLLPVDGDERVVAVRLIARRGDVDPRPSLGDAVGVLRRNLGDPAGDGQIRVRTPAGDPRLLPTGSTVLNFCRSISETWVPLLDHAIVNGQRIDDPLQRLNTGDTVELALGRVAHPLPEGWRSRVPPATISGLERAEKHGLRRVLISSGRRYLQRRLGERDLYIPPESVDRVLEDAVLGPTGRRTLAAGPTRRLEDPDEAERTGGSPGRLGPPGRWWLHQLGLSEALEAAPEDEAARYPFKPEIDRRQVDLLVDVVYKAAREISALELPAHLRAGVDRLTSCPRCDPNLAEPLIVARTDDLLLLHRVGARCAPAEGERIARRVTVRQYIASEAANRPGVWLDQLKAALALGIDLQEVVARRDGDRALLRIEADCPDPKQLDNLVRRIRAVRGVRTVRAPHEPVDAGIEGLLPPRKDRPVTVSFRLAPYQLNAPIDRDEFFYGRLREVTAIVAEVQKVSSPHAQRGVNLAHLAALRTGKTSVAFRVVRELERRDPPGFLCATAMGLPGKPWSAFSAKLARRLHRVAERAQRELRTSAPLPEDASLGELITLVRRWPDPPGIFLVIDEAVRIAEASSKDPAELADMLRFSQEVTDTPGVTALWVGPRAAAVVLPPSEFRNRLFSDFVHVPLDPMSEHDIRALASAEKLAIPGGIRLDDGLPARLRELTGGDVYLVAHLAHAMWERHRERGRATAHYTRADLDAAVEAVVNEGGPLLVGEQSLSPELRPAASIVLQQLARPLDAEPARADRRALANALAATGLTVASGALDLVLDELVDVGMLRRTRTTGQDDVYDLRARLLSYFLHARSSGPR